MSGMMLWLWDPTAGEWVKALGDAGGRLTPLILAKTGDATYQSPRIDPATHALEVIDYAHHESHDGSAYFTRGYSDRANNEVVDIRISPPDTAEWAHFTARILTQSEFLFHIYEKVAITTVGTAYTPRNRNRNFNAGDPDQSSVAIDVIENTSVVNADLDTNLVAPGATDIFPGITGAGRSRGGSARAEEEIILRQNTIYCVRFVANAAGWVDWNISWYEHTNKAA